MVFQAAQGIEEQQRLVRGPPAATSELADAVEPVEQVSRSSGTTVAGRSKAGSDIARIERLRTRRKGPTGSALGFQSNEIDVPAQLRS
jgi:hypothetical protein